jgi:AAA15 family ATPase/GTPase
MLIEFRVRNFRSLRDEQVLSLVAAKDKTLVDTNTIETGLPAAPRLVRSAVVYGPNAGGKSNLLKALQWMQWFVVGSAQLERPPRLAVTPFRLDGASAGQPMAFEVTFVREGVRYQFGFALTAERVVREYLLVYKTAKPQKWYERTFDPATGQDRYEFGTGLSGQKTVWEKATRPNSLFLSIAITLNSSALKPVYEWFSSNLLIYNNLHGCTGEWSIECLDADTDVYNPMIKTILLGADAGISDIKLVTRKEKIPTLQRHPLTGEELVAEHEFKDIQFVHQTGSAKVEFTIYDESTGTQILFFLAGPILFALAAGFTILIDELDNSMHPLLVRQLVRLFHSTTLNSKGAQLIFCTHDSSLLDADLFRRDQIWFVEKDREQASKLYPLTEFSPRKNEALERGYLMGRYGALPFFRDWSL